MFFGFRAAQEGGYGVGCRTGARRHSASNAATVRAAVQHEKGDEGVQASVATPEVAPVALKLFNTEGRTKQPFRPQNRRFVEGEKGS